MELACVSFSLLLSSGYCLFHCFPFFYSQLVHYVIQIMMCTTVASPHHLSYSLTFIYQFLQEGLRRYINIKEITFVSTTWTNSRFLIFSYISYTRHVSSPLSFQGPLKFYFEFHQDLILYLFHKIRGPPNSAPPFSLWRRAAHFQPGGRVSDCRTTEGGRLCLYKQSTFCGICRGHLRMSIGISFLP